MNKIESGLCCAMHRQNEPEYQVHPTRQKKRQNCQYVTSPLHCKLHVLNDTLIKTKKNIRSVSASASPSFLSNGRVNSITLCFHGHPLCRTFFLFFLMCLYV